MKFQIKKYILSFFVVAAFVVYTFFERTVYQPGRPSGDQPLDNVKPVNSEAAPTAPATEPAAAEPPPALTKPLSSSGQVYKDGVYTGTVADAYYGKVQVRITVLLGKIIEAAAIAYPQENQTSVLISNQAIPALKAETIKAQSAQIDTVSGATYTSYAYATSLDAALAKAQIAMAVQTPANSTAGGSARPALTLPPANPVPQPPASIPPASTQPAPATGAAYKDGQYTGDLADAYYGSVQVQITIQGGKLADVRFLSYPQDRQTSLIINSQATPILRSEALAAQSANVDIVSGATHTSNGFIESLSSALNQAATGPQSGTPAQIQTQPPRYRREYQDD